MPSDAAPRSRAVALPADRGSIRSVAATTPDHRVERRSTAHAGRPDERRALRVAWRKRFESSFWHAVDRPDPRRAPVVLRVVDVRAALSIPRIVDDSRPGVALPLARAERARTVHATRVARSLRRDHAASSRERVTPTAMPRLRRHVIPKVANGCNRHGGASRTTSDERPCPPFVFPTTFQPALMKHRPGSRFFRTFDASTSVRSGTCGRPW